MMAEKMEVFAENWARSRCRMGAAFSSSTTGKIGSYPGVYVPAEALVKEVGV